MTRKQFMVNHLVIDVREYPYGCYTVNVRDSYRPPFVWTANSVGDSHKAVLLSFLDAAVKFGVIDHYTANFPEAEILEVPFVSCQLCNGGTEASIIAAQSEDGGKTMAWVPLCASHADGWNDGGYWLAPVFHLGARVE